jgi:hypothetical protein
MNEIILSLDIIFTLFEYYLISFVVIFTLLYTVLVTLIIFIDNKINENKSKRNKFN